MNRKMQRGASHKLFTVSDDSCRRSLTVVMFENDQRDTISNKNSLFGTNAAASPGIGPICE